MSDILGPSNAPFSTTVRPAETRTFFNDETWFKDCTNPDVEDGTDIQASWLNNIVAVLRSIARVNGNATDGNAVVADAGTDDSQVRKAIQHLIQRGQMVYGVDTGAANALVAALNPVLREYKEGLHVYVKAIANNTGATTINLNGLGVRDVVNATGGALAAGAIVAGRIYGLTYDGTRFQLIGSASGLVKLATNVDYYVDPVLGNDANAGTAPGAGNAWATLNYAYRWLQENINANGKTVTIHCAFPNSPTNYAAFAPSGGIVGVFSPAQLRIVGDTTNFNCAINLTAPGASAVVGSNLALFYLEGFALTASGTLAGCLNAYSGAQILLGAMRFGAAGSYCIQAAGPGSQITTTGYTCTFVGSCISAVRASQSATVNINNTTMIMGGITCSGGTISATDLGCVTAGAVTWGGSGVTGPRFSMIMGSMLDTSGAQTSVSAGYVPGSSAGSTATSGNFQ